MNIKIVNVQDESFHNCILSQTNGKGKDTVFIDWLPVIQDVADNKPLEQVELITKTKQDTPVIVFDRHCSITDRELLWFHDRNVVLMEPVLNHRNGFIFHPYWVDVVDPPLHLFDNDRSFDVGCLTSKLLYDDIFDELLKKNHKISVSTKNTDYHHLSTILINGNTNDIKSGRIPYIGDMLKSGTIPLLYHKHKWMYSLFDGLIVRTVLDLKWYVDMSKFLQYSFVKSVYENIEKNLPEMKTENFVSDIIGIFNKM